MKRLLSLLCIMAILIGAIAPCSVSAESATKTTHSTDIAVMSWNALNTPGVIENWAEYYTYNARIERAAEIFTHYDADSIGFQETNANVRNALTAMLRDYTMVPGTELTENLIFYRTDRMEVLESGTYWLSETPNIPSKYSKGEEERTATYAVLRNKTTGVKYIHFNTHLDYTDAMDFEMRVLREKIEEMRLKYPGIGIVATGDYNSYRTSNAYQIMVSDWPNVNMQDSLFCAPLDKVVNEGQTMLSGNLVIDTSDGAYENGTAIDHLFVSIDTLDVKSYKVMRDGDKDDPTIAASDHFGLYVELDVGEGSIKRTPPETRVTAAYGTAMIDGTLDSAYSASSGGTATECITYNNILSKNEMTTAKYYYLHDENYLYYYIDVKDAHVTSDSKQTHTYVSDSLEIYYNFAKTISKPTNFTDANGEAAYFNVYPDGYDVTTNYASDAVKAVLNDYKAVKTADGYAVEGKIPMSEIVNNSLNSGLEVEIGISFMINDDADDGANGERDYLIMSDSGEVLGCWSNPAKTASVYLMPNENVKANAGYGKVEVDGVKDEVYNSSATGKIEFCAFCDGGTAVPSMDYTSAKWWAAYDDENLYYYIDVTDAHVTDENKRAADYACVDNIEIYYSFDRATSYSTSDDESGYFTVYANGKDFKSSNIDDAAVLEALEGYVAKRTSTGYVIEGTIPMSAALKNKLNGNETVEIGLSFLLSDDTDNGAGVRDYLMVNDADVLAAWGNPSKTASLYLNPIPEKYILASYGAVELDGVLDAAYTDASSGVVNLCSDALFPDLVNLPDNEKTSLKYYVAHDRNYVYLYVDVTDHHVTPNHISAFTDKNGAYGVDSMEIYYNFAKGTTNPTSYADANGEAGRFVVFANGKDFVNTQAPSNVAAEVQSSYVAVHNDHGYAIELRIPLSETARQTLNSNNLTMGLAFLVNDDADDGNQDGGRDYFIFHNTSPGNSLETWGNPSSTEAITLAKNLITGDVVAKGNVTIDGIKDDIYNLSTSGKIENVLIRSNDILEAGDETKATYTFVRDDEYLYYFIDVTDSVVTDAEKLAKDYVGADGAEGIDCVEFYYNFARGTNSSSGWGDVTDEAGYFKVYANGKDFSACYISDEIQKKMTYVAVHTENGYAIEGKIPLSNTVKTELAAGNNVNFGVSFIISDDANNGESAEIDGAVCVREYVIVDTANVLSAWSNPSSINNMFVMEGNGTLPEPDKGDEGDEGTKDDKPAKTNFTVKLPEIEGLTITTDKQTYKAGETVTLDIHLDDGYEFVQDAGMYDYGHWSNSRQEWVYFVSCVYGRNMMGRSLKANGATLIWNGNTFVMPDHDVEVIAKVEKRETAMATKGSVVLDGVKDEAYEASSTIAVNRHNEQPIYYSESNPEHAYGYVNATYDSEYLYCFAEIHDQTKTTSAAWTKDVDAGTDLSLMGFDSITFFFDFLNTDDENTATNEYPFVAGESGMFVIDSLGVKTSTSGAVYNKLGEGFASYNGNTNKADYVVKQTDEGYNVELKIALSDSVKVKLAQATEEDRVEIGIGAIIVDDTDNNGGFDYENGGDTLICSSSLVANLWAASSFVRDENGHLQAKCYESPRWMSKMVLAYAEAEEEPTTPQAGYQAAIKALDTLFNVDENVSISVQVASEEFANFASAELKLSYDASILTFNEEASQLGSATVKVDAQTGTLTLEDYGAVKNFGTAYTLSFTAKAAGSSNVKLTEAAFSTQEKAAKDDLIPATISAATVNVQVTLCHNVELPEIFDGNHKVEDGMDYTFKVKDGTLYDYHHDVKATVDGQNAEVIDNEDGSYTVKNVTGKLVISGTRTPKTFTVTIKETDKDDRTESATYNTDYTYTIPSYNGYTVSVVVTYADGTKVPTATSESTLTIAGKDIIGNITITVTKTLIPPTTATVQVEGNAGSDVTYEKTAKPDADYTFTVAMDSKYDYTVSAKNGEKVLELTAGENGAYTISKADFKAGDTIVITVDKTIKTTNVEVKDYLTIDQAKMWLILVKTDRMENGTYTYQDNKMFWSEKYGAYCYLVISTTEAPTVTAEDLAIVNESATEVDYGMDVNMSDKVDANDAQLVYNMYNAQYRDFTEDVTMEKFLRADTNADCKIDVEDAQAVIGKLLG